MDLEHFRKLLLDKERDLQSNLAHLEGEARDSGQAEVGDSADEATVAESASESAEQSTVLRGTLEQVRDAVRRIDDGSYGKCTHCGREIERARLEAIPWTPYCLQDAERLDQKAGRPSATL